MSLRGAKPVMYIYNGKEADAEVEFDADGAVPEPPTGTTINRRRRQWQVSGTSFEAEGSKPVAIPVLKISLTDRF